MESDNEIKTEYMMVGGTAEKLCLHRGATNKKQDTRYLYKATTIWEL